MSQEETTQVADQSPATALEQASEEPRARDTLGRFMAAHGMPDEGKDAAPEEGDEKETQAAEGESDDVKAAAKGESEEAEKAPKGFEPESRKPAFTERQIRSAKELGYDEDEIADMDAEVWGAVLDQASQRISRKMSELGKLQQRMQGTKPDVEPDEPDLDHKDESLDIAFDEDDLFEDATSTKLNTLSKVVKGLAADMGRIKSAETERQERLNATERDAFFEGLVGDDDKSLFPEYGTGKMADYMDGSAEAEARNALWAEAEAIQAGYRLSGRPVKDSEALQIALDHYGRKQLDQAAQDELAGKINKRRKGALVRQSGRRQTADTESPDAKFDRAIDKFEKEHGIEIPER